MANDNDGGKREKDEGSLLSETLKKAFSIGVSAAFMTEENVRRYLEDMKMPKEILSVILQGASKSKDEITNRVSNEIIKVVSKIDWVKELARFAESHKFKINAEIEIVKKDGTAESSPESKA